MFRPFGTPDMCAVTTFDDLDYERRFYNNKDKNLFKKSFPVLLAINPYASQHDIKDYLERAYSVIISPKLQKYRDNQILINKVKNKRKTERDDFIFQHRHLKHTQIGQLQKNEFGGRLLTWDYIGKIIRKEKKRRGIKD